MHDYLLFLAVFGGFGQFLVVLGWQLRNFNRHQFKNQLTLVNNHLISLLFYKTHDIFFVDLFSSSFWFGVLNL